MGIEGVKEEWPLQRLIQMLTQLKTKEKDGWRQSLLTTVNMKDIGPDDRDDATEWIAKLTMHFSFHPETFFLACSILDRFITSVKAQPKYLKCIAVSCFYLASKICEEEDIVPCTGELVQESDCGCRVCDVLRMERIILEKLSWNINCTTALDYLHIFHMMSFTHFTDLTAKYSLSRHLALLTSHLMNALACYKVASFSNDVISLALTSLYLETLTRDPGTWTYISRQLQSLTQVNTHDFMMCRETLKPLLPSKYAEQLQMKPTCIRTLPEHHSANMEKFEMVRVAAKRKAASPSSVAVKEGPKKPHPNVFFNDQEMDVDAGQDTDETMTASESEEDPDPESKVSSTATPRPTYAEIVKYGASPSKTLSHDDMNIETSSCYAAARCGFQAACGFLSPVSRHHGSVAGIRT